MTNENEGAQTLNKEDQEAADAAELERMQQEEDAAKAKRAQDALDAAGGKKDTSTDGSNTSQVRDGGTGDSAAGSASGGGDPAVITGSPAEVLAAVAGTDTTVSVDGAGQASAPAVDTAANAVRAATDPGNDPQADQKASNAGAAADDFIDLNPKSKRKLPEITPGLERRTTIADLTQEVYADAVLAIKRGEYELEYAAKGIAVHFGAAIEHVRAELAKILNPVVEPVDGVIVTVPKRYQIHLVSGLKWIEAGTQKMERAIAEHWWSKNNGVKIFEQK